MEFLYPVSATLSVHVSNHIKASITWNMSSQYEAHIMYWLRILVAEYTGSHDCKVRYISVIFKARTSTIFCGSFKVPEFKFPIEWSESCQQSKKQWCLNRWAIKTPIINTKSWMILKLDWNICFVSLLSYLDKKWECHRLWEPNEITDTIALQNYTCSHFEGL